MKIYSFTFYILMLLFSVIACNVTPEPIQYGTESCHYCSMTIVDKTHASQTVTKKGKQFKYDAIECLVNDILLKENESELAHIFVANYTSPGEMIEAEKAFYFVSNAIPSPMGANLTAVKEQDKIESILKDNEYKTYTWVTLKEHFRGNKN